MGEAGPIHGVIPAKAGIQFALTPEGHRVPAFAEMTASGWGGSDGCPRYEVKHGAALLLSRAAWF